MMIQTSRVTHVQKKLTANAALYIKVMGFVETHRRTHQDESPVLPSKKLASRKQLMTNEYDCTLQHINATRLRK